MSKVNITRYRYTCDRCGREEECGTVGNQTKPSFFWRRGVNRYPEGADEICGTCSEQFIAWWDEGKPGCLSEVNIFEPGHGDPIWKSNDVKGRTLTRAIERRIATQIKAALSGDVAGELKRIVVQTRGRVAAEDAIMPLLEERFGNRLCYGTVRRLVERYYLSEVDAA